MALAPRNFRLPRLVVAAPASGHGKTTVAMGLMTALRERGVEVSGHKVGPDYIDPSYHALATGRAPRNLDPHLQGEERIVPLLLHGALAFRPADIAVIEGVLGLFDGALGTDGFASTAHVAQLTGSPVILVVDASAAGRSVAAVVHGFATFDPGVSIAGVILNKVGSDRHETELRSAVEGTGVPVLGALRRSAELQVPSRHLGLVPAGERRAAADEMLARLRSWIADGVDLEAVVRVAAAAPPVTGKPWNPAAALGGRYREGPRTVIAAAAGQAFTFRYTENVELLAAAGADVVDVDPLSDEALPDECAGLYFGGGFPEVHAEALSANAALRTQVAEAARTMPVVAECAGLTYLCRQLDGLAMTGVLDATAAMTERRILGYRTATAAGDHVLAHSGEQVTGHEFHRTEVTPRHGEVPAWEMDAGAEGFAGPGLLASYLHIHWAGHPHMAQRFADAARRSPAPQRPAF
ncbi:cobyrinate a,c-diamide synthase [Phytoactinopolyspora alkaliphila]|uniref:Hydrogenobyrinate a,c-diamide synthase n=1 Tax=Phytoactinopolyspora alkaliphila TaxID=1783498 RepID=A0A6N9YKY4_9ACTN|nr:cobyrinate a,c-diamide synthase [Phytoactinopolyspora alkaliphila]NED95539.1 cobyrinate a,c-diamide synthase [Phytoactinopolyspora alkaliphila]